MIYIVVKECMGNHNPVFATLDFNEAEKMMCTTYRFGSEIWGMSGAERKLRKKFNEDYTYKASGGYC